MENFQSHPYSEFNLDKGLNVLVGMSNMGKTSLTRALSLVLFNQWDRSWVRSGAKFCKIIIHTDTGIIVERQKGDKINKYILTLPNQKSQLYENFGTTTPEAVQQALRIHEVQIDSKDSINLNMAGQLEQLFLLSAPNSYKAKVFGKLSGAHILDAAIREINREGRSFSTEKAIKEKELVELQSQVDKLSQIERFSTQIVEIEEKLASLSVQESRLDAIRSLLERVKSWKVTWTQETAKQEVLEQVDLSVLSKLSVKVDNLSKIYILSGIVKQWKKDFERQNAIQSLLAGISTESLPDKVQKVERLKVIRDLNGKLYKNSVDFKYSIQELERIGKSYMEATKQYGELLKKNGVCPICGESTVKEKQCL